MTSVIADNAGISIQWSSPLWTTKREFGLLSNEISGYSHTLSINGLYKDATISLQVDRGDAEDWFINGLGRDIRIANSSGITIFKGYVDQVDMSQAGVSASMKPLSETANRVYCTYNPIYVGIDNSTGSGQTEAVAVQDTTSQSKYGIWETIIDAGNCFVDPTTGYNEAAQAQALYLLNFKAPQARWQTSNQGSNELRISCRGYYTWLGAYLYQYRPTTPLSVTFTAKLQAVIAANINASVISSGTSKIGTNASLTLNVEDKYRTATDIVESIIDAGDSSGNIWRAYVDESGVFNYEQVSLTPYYLFSVIDGRQQMRLTTGSDVNPWDVLPGKVAFLNDWMMGLSGPPGSLGEDTRVGLINEVRYTAPWSFTVSTEPINQFQSFINRKGLGGYY